jgi:hypothetical protein
MSAGRGTFLTEHLQHGFVEAELRHQLLQPGILLNHLLELTNLVRFQAGVLPLPPVECLLRYPDLPDQIRHRQAQLRLLQHRDDLLDRKPLLLHRRTSSTREIRRKN